MEIEHIFKAQIQIANIWEEGGNLRNAIESLKWSASNSSTFSSFTLFTHSIERFFNLDTYFLKQYPDNIGSVKSKAFQFKIHPLADERKKLEESKEEMLRNANVHFYTLSKVDVVSHGYPAVYYHTVQKISHKLGKFLPQR